MTFNANAKPKKPVPGKNPETIPTEEPEPDVWPKREPDIQPEKEPLTVPPSAPPEAPSYQPGRTDEQFISEVKHLQSFFDTKLHLLYVNTPLFFKSDPESTKELLQFATANFKITV
jgi:hypothetical protein